MTIPHHWKPSSITPTNAPPLLGAINEYNNYIGLKPIEVIVPYSAGVIPANDSYEWEIAGSCKVLSIIALFSGNLTGTFTIEVYDGSTLKRAINLSYANTGQTLTDAWIYEPVSLYLKENCKVRVKSSKDLLGLEAYCEPRIIDESIIGKNI